MHRRGKKMILKIIAIIIVGALAGRIMNAGGSLVKNIVIGIIGSVVGGVVFGIIGISSHGLIGYIILSTVGACLAIYLARKFLK